MSAIFEIPLASTCETFLTSLNGRQYRLRVTWCAPGQMWVLDVENSDGTKIVEGMAMVTGADLLEQYAYLDITGQLIVQSDDEPFRMPTFTDLGSNSHLYYVSPQSR